MDFKVKRNDSTWFTDVDLEVLEKRIRISNGIIYLKRKSSSSYDLTQSVEDQYSMRKPIMHKRSDADGEKRCECNATYLLHSKRKETILLRFKQKTLHTTTRKSRCHRSFRVCLVMKLLVPRVPPVYHWMFLLYLWVVNRSYLVHLWSADSWASF